MHLSVHPCSGSRFLHHTLADRNGVISLTLPFPSDREPTERLFVIGELSLLPLYSFIVLLSPRIRTGSGENITSNQSSSPQKRRPSINLRSCRAFILKSAGLAPARSLESAHFSGDNVTEIGGEVKLAFNYLYVYLLR